MQRPWGNAAFWLSPHGLFQPPPPYSKPSYISQWRKCLTDLPRGQSYRGIFLNWDSSISDDTSLGQVEVNETVSLWVTSLPPFCLVTSLRNSYTPLWETRKGNPEMSTVLFFWKVDVRETSFINDVTFFGFCFETQTVSVAQVARL